MCSFVHRKTFNYKFNIFFLFPFFYKCLFEPNWHCQEARSQMLLTNWDSVSLVDIALFLLGELWCSMCLSRDLSIKSSEMYSWKFFVILPYHVCGVYGWCSSLFIPETDNLRLLFFYLCYSFILSLLEVYHFLGIFFNESTFGFLIFLFVLNFIDLRSLFPSACFVFNLLF